MHNRYGYNQGIYYYDLTEYYPKGQYLAYSYRYDIEGATSASRSTPRTPGSPPTRLTINAGVRVDFVRGNSPALDKTDLQQHELGPAPRRSPTT